MKNLVSVAICAALVLGSSMAGAVPMEDNDAGVAKVSVLSGSLGDIKPAIFSAGEILDLHGANIFWVLGGGLVAVSLLARRIS